MAQEAATIAAAVCLKPSAATLSAAVKAHQPHSRLLATSSSSSTSLVTVAISQPPTVVAIAIDDGDAGLDDSTYAAELEQSKSTANGLDAINAANDAHDAEHDESVHDLGPSKCSNHATSKSLNAIANAAALCIIAAGSRSVQEA